MFNDETQKNVKVKKKWSIGIYLVFLFWLTFYIKKCNVRTNNATNLMATETTPTSTDSLTRENVKSEVAKTIN